MIGSFLIGIAVWCAVGTIAVASPDSATARIVVGAPWWVFLIGVAFAAAIRPWRTRPLTALPALLTIIPWLPVPLPAVALIWTGPMAWVPIIAALALAIGIGPLRLIARWLNLLEPDDATVAAFVLAAMLGGLAAWAADPRTPSGDEPHYLIITESILKDGDLDIANNHANRDYASFFGGDLKPDLLVRGIHGEAYSIHAPGVSVLVAPMFQFFGYKGARFLLVLLTSIGAMLTWRAAWRATDSAAAAWCGWAAVVLTPTFAMQSFMVFPDAPGMLVIAAATLLLVQLSRGDTPGLLPVSLTGVGIATLPWLHTRFALLAAGFGGLIVLRFILPGEGRTRAPINRLVAFVCVPIVSVALWLWFFKVHYGIFDPRAPYGVQPQELAWIVPAILALFFDSQYGIGSYAPAIALAFAGWWRRTETFSRRLGIELALIALVYLAAVTTVRMWWAGLPATPARFLMALLPVLAVPVAVAWTRVTVATRTLAVALVAIGAGVTAVLLSVDRANLAWNLRWEQPLWLEWLSPVANLSRAWPSFFWQEAKFPYHVVAWLLCATALWLIARRFITNARAAVTVWGIVTITVLAPIGWAWPGGVPLDPAPAQLRIIADEGDGRLAYAIGAWHLGRLRSLKGAMTLRPLEPGPADPLRQPPLLGFDRVPAGRYVAHVRSTAPGDVILRLFTGRSATPWREFTVPGAGEFQFPFVLPASVPRVVLDTDAPMRATMTVELAVEEALPALDGVSVRATARYGADDVLFLDDQVFAEPQGFWVRGRSATRFLLVPTPTGPVAPLTVRVLIRNGGAANTVTIETGSFQRLLVMAPFDEEDVDIPLTPSGRANVRIASGDGFVPADVTPPSTDRRLLGVWIQPR